MTDTAAGSEVLAIEYRTVGGLKPDPRNARTHPRRQLEQIKASIQEFGFTNPILIDEQGVIIAGHGRVGEDEDEDADLEDRLYAARRRRRRMRRGWPSKHHRAPKPRKAAHSEGLEAENDSEIADVTVPGAFISRT